MIIAIITIIVLAAALLVSLVKIHVLKDEIKQMNFLLKSEREEKTKRVGQWGQLIHDFDDLLQRVAKLEYKPKTESK